MDTETDSEQGLRTRAAAYRPGEDAFRDRVVLVTGAGDGIGRAVARALAAHGATVVLLGRTVKKLEAVYDAIVEAGHPEPAIYPMNLEGAAPKDHDELAITLDTEFGRLDGLLHNAAMLGALSPVEHHDPVLWARVLQVNLGAPFLLTRSCIRLLRAATDPAVVFNADTQLGAYWGAYGVSKHGLVGFMRILAAELDTAEQPVRVNAVDPGPVRTDLRVRAYPAENADALPRPEDVVAPFLYLLGPEGRGVTGELLRTGS